MAQVRRALQINKMLTHPEEQRAFSQVRGGLTRTVQW
jgi:hypothetical protein